MDIEEFLKTKYDIKEISNVGGTYIVLSRVGSDSSLVIMDEFLQHFYDMGDRGYLVKRAKEIYNETKNNRTLIRQYNERKNYEEY